MQKFLRPHQSNLFSGFSFKTFVLSAFILIVSFAKAKADCSMTSLGAAGTYTIAQLAANGTLSTCTGKLTIPSGYVLNLSTTTALPSGISEIDVLNGGSILVSVDYTFPNTLLKLSLLDSDGAGTSPSGNLNYPGNNFLTVSSATQIYIQNTTTTLNSAGSAIFAPVNQATRIYIGSDPYAAANNPNGAGVCFSFNQVIANGGTPQLAGDVSIGSTSASGNIVCFNTQPFNLNASLVFNATFTNAPTFSWSQISGPGTSTIGTDTNPALTSTTNATTVTTPGTYVFRITAVQNLSVTGCIVSATITLVRDITVVVRPTPTASISIAPAAVCQNATGPTVTFTNTLSLPITVTYSGPTSGTINVPANSTNTIVGPSSTTGTNTYTITQVAYQDGSPGCANTTGLPNASYTVNPNPNNVTNGFASGGDICVGSNGQLSFNANDGSVTLPFTITYTDGTTSWTQSINSAAATTFNVAVNPIVTTTYTLTKIENSTGCSITSGFADATAQLIVKQQPTASAGGNQSICAGSSATVSGASSSNGTILWTHNGGGTLTNATTLTPSYQSVAGDVGNAVTLTMTVSNAPCVAATSTYTINVTQGPTAVVSGGGTYCSPNPAPDVSIALTGTAPWSLTYSDGTTSFPITGILASPYVISLPANGTYTVTALSDAVCSGTFSGSAVVAFNAPPTVSCPGPITANTNTGVCYATPNTGIPTVELNLR